MTKQEEILKLMEGCIDSTFKKPANFIVPTEGTVIIKKNGNTEEFRTDGGIIIPDSSVQMVNRRTVTPNIGTIYAVGPLVPEYIKEGVRVYFNQNNDLEFLISGGYYHMAHYSEVFGGIPDKALASIDVREEKEVIREDNIVRMQKFNEKKIILDGNNKDKTIN